jgi:hypothetical protein
VVGGRIAMASLLLLASSPLAAEEAAGPERDRLTIELNALQPSDRGCRVTFVASNDLDGDVERAAYELAFFDTAGLVARLSVVDFLELDRGRTKVRQFDFAGMECASIGRILINDLAECAGDGIAPKACLSQLSIQNKTSIQFGT